MAFLLPKILMFFLLTWLSLPFILVSVSHISDCSEPFGTLCLALPYFLLSSLFFLSLWKRPEILAFLVLVSAFIYGVGFHYSEPSFSEEQVQHFHSRLEGKLVMITGISGIAESAAEMFLRQGADVVIAGIFLTQVFWLAHLNNDVQEEINNGASWPFLDLTKEKLKPLCFRRGFLHPQTSRYLDEEQHILLFWS